MWQQSGQTKKCNESILVKRKKNYHAFADLEKSFGCIAGLLLFWSMWGLGIGKLIVESKGMGAIFQKKGKEMLKKDKRSENLGKNVLNLKIF